MGAPDSEPGRSASEGPLRRVTIGAPFAVGAYEVTFAEWDACVLAGGCGGVEPDDGGWGRERRPVINVSWDQVYAYLAWLSAQTGHRYRLLTGAEWVQDCRNPLYRGAPRDGSAWEEGDCSVRLVRGGSWDTSPAALRVAARFPWPAGHGRGTVGFRVARDVN